MVTRFQSFWQGLVRPRAAQPAAPVPAEVPQVVMGPSVPIASNDPILLYFQSAPGVVDVETLRLDSPALVALKQAGVKLVLPLINQGELLGLVNLGPRRSEQDYSSDDRRLLSDLATQAAPTVRVAQLVRQQEVEARERERIQQELRVARLIQQTLLPKTIPTLPGWQMAAHYQPARAVGGDFYDFFSFPDGQLGIVVGDVTDKGVPAALVMATTRAILRGASRELTSPGEMLRQANDLLQADIPPKMFVTCLYAVLDPQTGRLRYANAGHDLPYRRSTGGTTELRARGMPLGLMPGMHYEEQEVWLEPGDSVLFYSDGLVEAHNREREMYGFPRLQRRIGEHEGGRALIPFLLGELEAWTGQGWEQEDDVTLVVLEREAAIPGAALPELQGSVGSTDPDGWKLLAEFSVPSEQGNERLAMQQVASVLQDPAMPWPIPASRLQRLKTAVAEATMNAMEHGNGFRADVPVQLQVLGRAGAVAVRITDQGGSKPAASVEIPDLEAKLAGLQSPRGWGLFLIEKMVDEMHVTSDDRHHTIELVLYHGGDFDGHPTP